MKNQAFRIINEFYPTIAPLLVYESDETTDVLSHRILESICLFEGVDNKTASDCKRLIDGVRDLSVCEDQALVSQAFEASLLPVADLKLKVILERKIETTQHYAECLLIDALKESANRGDVGACKMMAHLYWLGLLLPEDKDTSCRIWTLLATAGDFSAIRALIYIHKESGNTAEWERWSRILATLSAELNTVSVIAHPENHPNLPGNDLEYVNLIMLGRTLQKSPLTVNLPLLQYILYSSDTYRTKVEVIHSQRFSEFYSLVKKTKRSTIGF